MELGIKGRKNMEKYDCVLLAPPSRSINHFRPPMGLIYLGGYLKRKGLSVKIVDVPMDTIVRDEYFFENRDGLLKTVESEMISQFVEMETDYVGISCYSPEYEEVVRLIHLIRESKPNIKIVVGGIHPTLKPYSFRGLADIIIVGEGEVALYEAIKFKKEGVVYAKKIPIDNCSYPDYSLVDMGYYTNANPYAIRGVFLRTACLLGSRGCPSQCSFCVAPALKNYFSFQVRNPCRVVEEVLDLKHDYNIDAFYFIDDCFTFDKEKVKKFCEMLIFYETNLLWGCSSKINTLDENLIKLMAKSGCIQIDFGVERGSDRELKRLKKYQTIENIKNIFKLCKKYNIRTFANMLVNIPGERKEDYEDIKILLSEIKPTVVSVNIYKGYLGTELLDKIPEGWVITWAELVTKRYNSIWKAILFHLKFKYLKTLFRSKRKLNYAKQFSLLIKESINQIF